MSRLDAQPKSTLQFLLETRGKTDGPRGLQRYEEVAAGLDRVVSPRTAQRWLGRAVTQALVIQQAIRAAVIERSEPRPVEHRFPS